jgi:hypothetical protein
MRLFFSQKGIETDGTGSISGGHFADASLSSILDTIDSTMPEYRPTALTEPSDKEALK